MTIDIHFASIVYLLSRRVELAIIWPCKVMLKIWTKVKVTWSEKVMLHISRSISSAWTQLRWPMSPLVMSPMSKFRDIGTFYRYCCCYCGMWGRVPHIGPRRTTLLISMAGSFRQSVSRCSYDEHSNFFWCEVAWLTWWPDLEWPGSEISIKCAEKMYEQVCQKRPPFSSKLERNCGGKALNSLLSRRGLKHCY